MDDRMANALALETRTQSSSTESDDITNTAALGPAPTRPEQELRKVNQRGTRGAAVSPTVVTVHVKRDLVERFFLASDEPNVALFAISICLVGVMDFLPQHTHDPEMWSDKIASVNGFYGPGVIVSWCLMSMSMLYDANQLFKQNPDGFHYFKYASLMLSGVWALGDAVWRALHTDFGPSYAAALYMSDKGFEVAVLLYTLNLFPVHRRHATKTTKELQQQRPDEERANQGPKQRQSIQSQAAAAIERYKIFPCIPMVSVWVWCRALANGHTVYNIHAQNPNGVTISWKPVLAWYWKPVVVTLCFGLSSLVSALTSWGWRSWSLPVGILSSFGILHSGLFGTFTPLKLTALNITEEDQMAALISTVLLLMVQYGRQISVIKKGANGLAIFFFRNEDNQERQEESAHAASS